MASLAEKNNDYYRKLIVDHYSNPSNKGLLKTKTSLHFHHFTNSCVDDFYVELTFDHDTIIAARFDGIGCAISTAAIDIFCTMITGHSLALVEQLNANYQKMLAQKPFKQQLLGDLLAFANVLKQPARIRCALIISESLTEIVTLRVNQHEQ